MIALRLRIVGKVQGVYFRASAKEEADRLGVRGRIWNARDGAVEACVEGMPDAVDAFVTWCGDGPRGAQVDGVQVERTRSCNATDFTIASAPLPGDTQ